MRSHPAVFSVLGVPSVPEPVKTWLRLADVRGSAVTAGWSGN